MGYRGGPVVWYYGGWGIMTGGALWSGVLGGGGIIEVGYFGVVLWRLGYNDRWWW